MKRLDSDACEALTVELRSWRQGDCFVGEYWFVVRINPDATLTDEADVAAQEGFDNAETEELGFMVVTQTCDLVRDCESRPYVELAPLVNVKSPSLLEDIKRGRILRYAFVPGVADQGLVADLDRIMTAEKAILTSLARTPGCQTDDDFRRLGLALARKRARFAFPDDFVEFVGPLAKRIRSKHNKESDEGAALRALREIRVRANDWEAASVELMFWFICDEPSSEMNDYLTAWEKLIPATGRFLEVYAEVTTLDDMTARDHVESDSLDLDHLSMADD